MLVYPDVRAAVAWLTAAFGFEERVRIGADHRSQMRVGDDGAVIVADIRGDQVPPEPGIVTHGVRVRVNDVDSLCARARSHGAQIRQEPIEYEYGERECSVVDLAGHHWQFTQTIHDVEPERWGGQSVDSPPASALSLVAVSFDAVHPAELAAFWAGMLGREIVVETSGALLPGDDTQVGLRFVAAATEKSEQNRVHLHLTSSTLDDQWHTVDAALRLGGRHVDVGQLPEEDHVVLADPGGNEFCVIEPGNNFLAGCGTLGEVSCDGTREVGLFWRDALGWPLVWDQDDETAVQSPRGGTKVSWGGPPVAAKNGRNRQHLDLAAPDLAVEVIRLVALGATELGDRDGSVELADPDGNEFSVSPD